MPFTTLHILDRLGSIQLNTGKTDHDRAVKEYRAYILKKPELLERLPELRGKVLGCWCYPKICHGNILIELSCKKGPRMDTNRDK
jgi:hypothetical protein